MLQIDNTVISLDLLEERFVCDLVSCKGACCIEGDSGAPLEDNEIEIIEELMPLIWDDLSDVSKKVIEKQGVFYIDEDNEPVTSIVSGRECVFTFTDENGICKCAIEKAYREGKTDFYKPISCHLYPVRLQKYKSFTAVNFHKWNICDCALVLGSKLKVPAYVFLKEPLVRKFGKEWYEQLEIADKQFYSKEE
ncbi:MAG: DUF3109 family protein [Paludibacteraceae bacterium]|jgi:hypothetical protein|nr:DUF3109 family protein [Paludibacteraceae bacterium]